MEITKKIFSDSELYDFTSKFQNMSVHTEPIMNIITSCIQHSNIPIIDYYQKEYLSNKVYFNYCNACSIINESFLKSSFGSSHFTFLSTIKHNNYILNCGSSDFLVSSTSKELINDVNNNFNIFNEYKTIKELILFSLKFQQMITLYGVSPNVPKKFENFFKRMIKHPDINDIIYANYDIELEKF